MSLKAGRVGVATSEVDSKGKIKGGSVDAYTKAQSDAKYENKENIGGLKFRVFDGSAQYKTPSGNWENFSSGSDIVVPLEVSPLYINTNGNISSDVSDPDVFGYIDLTQYVGKTVCLYCVGSNNSLDRNKVTRTAVAPAVGVTGTFITNTESSAVGDTIVRCFKVLASTPYISIQPSTHINQINDIKCYVKILD